MKRPLNSPRVTKKCNTIIYFLVYYIMDKENEITQTTKKLAAEYIEAVAEIAKKEDEILIKQLSKNLSTEYINTVNQIAKKIASEYRETEKKFMDVVHPAYTYKGVFSMKFSCINGTLKFIVKDEEGIFHYTQEQIKERIEYFEQEIKKSKNLFESSDIEWTEV